MSLPAKLKAGTLSFWRGEQKSNYQFFLIYCCFVCLSVLFITYSFRVLTFRTDNLVVLFSAATASLSVSLSILCWGVVGTIRSTLPAEFHRKKGIDVLFKISRPSFKRVLIVVSLALLAKPLASLAVDTINLGATVYDSQFEKQNSSVVAQSNRVLLVSGSPGERMFNDIESALRSNTRAEMVILESEGGNVYWAKKIAQIINRHELHTHVNDSCLSSCTLILMSGKNRTASFYAKIGFHIASAKTTSFLSHSRSIQEFLRAKGVSKEFIDRLEMYEGSEMLFPTYDILVKEGFLTSITMPHLFFDVSKYPIERLAKVSMMSSPAGNKFLNILNAQDRQVLQSHISASTPISVEQASSLFINALFSSLDFWADKNLETQQAKNYISARLMPYSFIDLYGPLCELYRSQKFMPELFFDETYNSSLSEAVLKVMDFASYRASHIELKLNYDTASDENISCGGEINKT